jgi:membrane fusion protein (multidrug efflux system)
MIMNGRLRLRYFTKYLLILLATFFISTLSMVVNVRLGIAEGDLSDNRIRAQLTPYQQTTLSAEIAANISALPLREGGTFKKGQRLVSFDCALLNAQLNKANVSAELALQGYQVSKRLEDLNSISSFEMYQAMAKMKEANTELESMEVMVSKCSLSAPYAGKIAKLHVDAFQYVTPGTPLIDIVDTSQLEVRLIVPSSWLSWLKSGATFSILIEELGKTYQSRVVMIGARIDPVSQSLPITGAIEGAHNELLPGMSGWANFDKVKE